jgi:hypothetical protein
MRRERQRPGFIACLHDVEKNPDKPHHYTEFESVRIYVYFKDKYPPRRLVSLPGTMVEGDGKTRYVAITLKGPTAEVKSEDLCRLYRNLAYIRFGLLKCVNDICAAK